MAGQRRVPETRQQTLGFEALESEQEPSKEPAPATRFQDADPRDIWLGNTRLDEYLKGAGLGWVVGLRQLLRQVDVSELEEAYQAGGKPPFHPHVILGLLVYGITLGINSLRSLEQLGRRDVGAWWMTGGLQPDHSTLGRFLVRHAEVIQDGLFEKVTRLVLRRVGVPTQDVAGDGTVIEAAASRYNMLSAEAAAQYADEVNAAAGEEASPEQEAANELARVASERAEARRAKGRSSDVQVARTEPDAVMQKQKNGTVRPSYKASILANEHRFILAHALHPSSETAVVESLVAQAERTLESPLPTLSLDAGYFCLTVLLFCLHNDIDILCPSGRLDAKGEPHKKGPKGRLGKADFRFDEVNDVYICPADRLLTRRWQEKDSAGRQRVVYQAQQADCQSCPMRGDCTTSTSGRTVRRYDGEEVADAMRTVMDHPAARRRYRKRQASVEPIFSVWRARGFTRFRRRGERGAKIEVALHSIAYNLHRAVHLVLRADDGAGLSLTLLCARTPSTDWRLLAAWIAIG